MRTLMTTALLAATALAGTAVTTTSAFAQGGSYQASCRNIQNQGGSVSAECSDSSGRYRQTSIQASACSGDIGNNNGVLVCNGAQGVGGPYVSDNRGNGGGGRDRDRGGNTGAVVGAGRLGVVAGALLGGNLYQGQQTYPDYGQRGYGDPRVDPRYAEGGYGYGYRPGQFVPISRRVDWLDRRIDRGVQEGSLGRREANTLHDQLDDLVDMERRYSRNGLNNQEMAELDDRFDDLGRQIRFETRDTNNRPGGGYNNGGYNNGGYNNGYGR